MRLIVFSGALALILANPVHAASPSVDTAPPVEMLVEPPLEPPVADEAEAPDLDEARPQERLDALFFDLKRERSEAGARRIATRIQAEWEKSGSASVDLMMGWSKTAMDARKFDVALDFLDQVTVLKPAYAEGWNRRATVHFLMQNFSLSVSDINQTLLLEPRHFGALSGLAQILKNAGNKQSALEVWQRALDIYPMMRAAQEEVGTLSEELSGEGI